MTDDAPQQPGRIIPRADLLICLAILLATSASYARVVSFGFLGYDDGDYVAANIHLPAGLAVDNLNWIFLSFKPDNWFPLTRLSLILDYRLFGLQPAAWHVENVAIHCLAALLLFGFLRRATGARWPAAFVAFVFALHPLHVESVAWVAERKDVLCAAFWFAALWAWLRHVERPSPIRYTVALVLFACGLMSKPMIVTFPFLLFLLDLWPLKRRISGARIMEKLPYFALSAAVIAITLRAQHGGLQALGLYPFALRLENAVVTVFVYLGQTFLPVRLWAPYAYPDAVPVWESVVGAIGIAGVSALALMWRKTRPWLATGWFWFLGTLMPVIGLVQVGDQGHADRYVYVPMVGIAIIVAWAGAEAAVKWARIRRGLAVLGAALCVAMSVKTSIQTQYWKTTYDLFSHAIDMDAGNYLAWHHLGQTFSGDPGYTDAVITYYKNATGIRPGYVPAHNNLAIALTHAGRFPEAIEEFETAFTLDPGYAAAHSNLGAALARLGRKDDAVRELETALRLDPDSAPAHTELGAILWNTPGRTADGITHFEQAVRLDPDYALAWYDLGWALLNNPGRAAESIPCFRQALRVNPDLVAAHAGLATALLQVHGDKAGAIAHLKAAQEIHPDAARQELLDRLEQGGGRH